MKKPLEGKTVAILVTNGFEQIELTSPRQALEDAGARTEIVSPEEGNVQGWNHDKPGDALPVNRSLSEARPEDYAALLLPGGVMNPDQLRMNPEAVTFAHRFFQEGKPVAAICHGPWLLVESGDLAGRTVTSWPSLRTDITNAGATWVDQKAVVDRELLTSRNPGDLPEFNRRFVEILERHGQEREPVEAGTRVEMS